MNYQEKINYLETSLSQADTNYADSFRTDISFFFGDFSIYNPMFNFLKRLDAKDEIELWINKLTSRIVMRVDNEYITVEEIISDYYYDG